MICLPLLRVSDLANERVFDRHFTTVYRWAAGTTPSMRLPKPDAVLGGEPVWQEDTIREWAEEHKLSVNDIALDNIRRSQGVLS